MKTANGGSAKVKIAEKAVRGMGIGQCLRSHFGSGQWSPETKGSSSRDGPATPRVTELESDAVKLVFLVAGARETPGGLVQRLGLHQKWHRFISHLR